MGLRGHAKGILALLLCVHCSATFFVAVAGLALAGAGAPLLLGIRADVLLVPLAGLTLFFGWLWWGRRASAAAATEACEVPAAREPAPPARSLVEGLKQQFKAR